MKNKKAILMTAALILMAAAVVVSVLLFRRTDEQPELPVPESGEIETERSEWRGSGMPEGVLVADGLERQILNTADGSQYELRFPVFRGFPGALTDDKINALVRDACYDYFRGAAHGLYGMMEDGTKVTYIIESYEITYADALLLSMTFTGFLDLTNEKATFESPRTIIRYSLNIDVPGAKEIDSREIFSDFSAFRARFLDGKLTQKEGIASLCESVPYATMLVEFREDYHIYPDLFFTDGGVCVIIPLTFDMGGFAVFRDEFADARAYLDLTLPVFAGLSLSEVPNV